ncbi:MAG: GGDEF domain-containing protein [Desulfobacterales bacterium]
MRNASEGIYPGRIIGGTYSSGLQAHVRAYVSMYESYDAHMPTVIPYIAAWHSQGRQVWYEFIGKRLLEIFKCNALEAAVAFRRSILERRVYDNADDNAAMRPAIQDIETIRRERPDLRAEVIRTGMVEAIYKSAPPEGRPIWFKDLALVETCLADGIHLSLGCLTDVSKEMETEAHLERVQEALRKSREKYRELSVQDNLTGLYNTRYLYQKLDELVKAAPPEGQSIALIFLDVDDFKSVVDSHGHLNASRTLQQLGGTLRQIIAPPGFGVAYGGDEFVIVLPDCGKADALVIAETVWERIREETYLGDQGLEVKIKASFGVAVFPEDAGDMNEILGLADQAMFHVKTSGKDSVCGHSVRLLR